MEKKVYKIDTRMTATFPRTVRTMIVVKTTTFVVSSSSPDDVESNVEFESTRLRSLSHLDASTQSNVGDDNDVVAGVGCHVISLASCRCYKTFFLRL
jgi:hypothetical protein